MIHELRPLQQHIYQKLNILDADGAVAATGGVKGAQDPLKLDSWPFQFVCLLKLQTFKNNNGQNCYVITIVLRVEVHHAVAQAAPGFFGWGSNGGHNLF